MAGESTALVSMDPEPHVSTALCKGGGPWGLSGGMVRGGMAWSCEQDTPVKGI